MRHFLQKPAASKIIIRWSTRLLLYGFTRFGAICLPFCQYWTRSLCSLLQICFLFFSHQLAYAVFTGAACFCQMPGAGFALLCSGSAHEKLHVPSCKGYLVCRISSAIPGGAHTGFSPYRTGHPQRNGSIGECSSSLVLGIFFFRQEGVYLIILSSLVMLICNPDDVPSSGWLRSGICRIFTYIPRLLLPACSVKASNPREMYSPYPSSRPHGICGMPEMM